MLPHPLRGFSVGPIDPVTGENYGTSEAHAIRGVGPAVDIPAPGGTPIPPPVRCVVMAEGDEGDVARGVWRRVGFDWDGHEVEYEYCHMERTMLRMVAGTVLEPPHHRIGYVGATGNATGAHIHLKVFVDGQRVRPEDYIDFEEGDDMDRDRIRRALDGAYGIAQLLKGLRSAYGDELEAYVLAVKEETGA